MLDFWVWVLLSLLALIWAGVSLHDRLRLRARRRSLPKAVAEDVAAYSGVQWTDDERGRLAKRAAGASPWKVNRMAEVLAASPRMAEALGRLSPLSCAPTYEQVEAWKAAYDREWAPKSDDIKHVYTWSTLPKFGAKDQMVLVKDKSGISEYIWDVQVGAWVRVFSPGPLTTLDSGVDPEPEPGNDAAMPVYTWATVPAHGKRNEKVWISDARGRCEYFYDQDMGSWMPSAQPGRLTSAPAGSDVDPVPHLLECMRWLRAAEIRHGDGFVTIEGNISDMGMLYSELCGAQLADRRLGEESA